MWQRHKNYLQVSYKVIFVFLLVIKCFVWCLRLFWPKFYSQSDKFRPGINLDCVGFSKHLSELVNPTAVGLFNIKRQLSCYRSIKVWIWAFHASLIFYWKLQSVYRVALVINRNYFGITASCCPESSCFLTENLIGVEVWLCGVPLSHLFGGCVLEHLLQDEICLFVPLQGGGLRPERGGQQHRCWVCACEHACVMPAWTDGGCCTADLYFCTERAEKSRSISIKIRSGSTFSPHFFKFLELQSYSD